MSPGYDHPRQEDFGRRITHSCLFCHNGYPQLPEPSDRYGQRSVFRTELPSASVATVATARALTT